MALSESCNGDPIQCIQTMWTLQDSEQDKKPPPFVEQCKHLPEKPSNVSSATTVACPLYIQPPPYPTNIRSVASGPLSPVVTDSYQQQHPSAGVMTSTAGGISSGIRYHLPLHFANTAVMHQSLTAGKSRGFYSYLFIGFNALKWPVKWFGCRFSLQKVSSEMDQNNGKLLILKYENKLLHLLATIKKMQ